MIKVGHDLTDAEIAARYDAFGGELSMHLRISTRPWPSLSADVSGQRALDAGCGAGRFWSSSTGDPTAELCGLEISSANVDKARTHLGMQLILCRRALLNLPPLPAAFFDTVILTEVLRAPTLAAASAARPQATVQAPGSVLSSPFPTARHICPSVGWQRYWRR